MVSIRTIEDAQKVQKLLPSIRTAVVIGGGVIGLEMASYFCSIGSEVTVVEMLEKIAGPTEAEISKILQNNYAKRGVKFILSADAHAADAIDCAFDRFGDCEAFVSSPVKK